MWVKGILGLPTEFYSSQYFFVLSTKKLCFLNIMNSGIVGYIIQRS